MFSLTHGLIYGAVVTGYLFLCMIVFSPRVWGDSDRPGVMIIRAFMSARSACFL